MTEYKNVLVCGEIHEGNTATITKELLGGARKIADDLGEELHILLMGDDVSGPAEEALGLGADAVFVIENPKLKDYQPELYTAAVVHASEELNPRILLLGHTDMGADLGPRLSFRFHTAIATDCVELSIQPETKALLRTKPVYGGMAMAVYVSDDFPQMATIRSKSLSPAERIDSPKGRVVPLKMDMEQSTPYVKVLEKCVEETAGIRLEDAEVIVAGGRGIGDADGFKELDRIAKFLKGTVGASRVACDNNWTPTSLQVGLTGTIVAPKLYLAVGISGASQHMTGCARSKTIVAINKDPLAPIFKQAHYGVVGDWKVVLPAFMDKLGALE
jgi:electron transfer flavoprotein alpha subunit